MKIVKIKLTLREDNNADMKAILRIGRRINELKKVLAYSAKPYDIRTEPFIENKVYAGERHVFVVDEVYEPMVMDVINTLTTESYDDWAAWFHEKYKVC